jgi:long-chain acyl-CoA synthetase
MHIPWPRQDLPEVPAEIRAGCRSTLTALLDQSLRRHAKRPALRCGRHALRFGALDDHARALAAWLQGQGLVAGDRVALMLRNVAQYPVAVLAILRAGLVVVNLDPAREPAELAWQLRDAGARALLACESMLATLEAALEPLPPMLVVLASPGDLLGPVRGRCADLLRPHRRRRRPRLAQSARLERLGRALAVGRRMVLAPAPVGPDSMAILQYTGGTTGRALGVVLSHRNLVANVLQCEAWNRPALASLAADEQPAMLVALPLHQIFGFTVGLLLGLRLGACSVLVPDPVDPRALVRTLLHQPVHGVLAVNHTLAALMDEPEFGRVDWHALTLTVSGGMAVRPETATRWQQLTGCPVTQGYGLTEAGPCVSCNPVSGAGRAVPAGWAGSVGLPLPGTEVKVLDEAGHEVAPGARGEIAVRGPQVMAGYWQRPDETARVMTPAGFLRTGDLGRIDADGHLHLLDRRNDLILVSGLAVMPAEVEGVVTRMPGVRECAAVGVPHERIGEAVKLVVVKDDPASPRPSEADVRAFCETRLSGHQWPRLVEFRAELPRSTLGKVLRRELRDAA